jgi:hypothetical protein
MSKRTLPRMLTAGTGTVHTHTVRPMVVRRRVPMVMEKCRRIQAALLLRLTVEQARKLRR